MMLKYQNSGDIILFKISEGHYHFGVEYAPYKILYALKLIIKNGRRDSKLTSFLDLA